MTLHWLAALLIVGGFTLGLSMVDLPISRQKLQWYAWHKWIGLVVLALTIAAADQVSAAQRSRIGCFMP